MERLTPLTQYDYDDIYKRGSKMNKIVCKRCGYEWHARIENPRECPSCKSRYYKSLKSNPRPAGVEPSAPAQAVKQIQ